MDNKNVNSIGNVIGNVAIGLIKFTAATAVIEAGFKIAESAGESFAKAIYGEEKKQTWLEKYNPFNK